MNIEANKRNGIQFNRSLIWKQENEYWSNKIPYLRYRGKFSRNLSQGETRLPTVSFVVQ